MLVGGSKIPGNHLFCCRLAFSKDSTVSTTAGATVRHLVSAVYDRAAAITDPPPAKVRGLSAVLRSRFEGPGRLQL